MEKGRLEAFSDGVFAVAITLLVLDLHVERESPISLADQFREQWPSFAAYLVSFFIIGVVWLNHHSLLRLATAVDRHVLVANLVLLLFVTAIPFTTSTYADFVLDGRSDARVAVLAYGIVMEGMAVGFTVMLARLQRAGLIGAGMTPAQGRAMLRRYGIGTLLYPAITLVALPFPPLMLVLYAVVVGYYLGPGLRTLDGRDGTVRSAGDF